MTLFFIIISSLAGGVLSVLAAAVVLAVPSFAVDKVLPRLISFSTGTLLGAALLGMIPTAASSLSLSKISPVVLLGLILFFVLEKMLIWRHCHKHDCHVHASSGPLLLVGDAVHNFVDGVVIAGAFIHSPALGFAAALSTVAHEIPQELGEFMVYLRSGYSKKRALLLNSITSLTSVLGAVIGYFFLSWMRSLEPYLLAFAAAGFLYVALADLVPAQRAATNLKQTLLDFVLVLIGIGIIALIAQSHHHGAIAHPHH